MRLTTWARLRLSASSASSVRLSDRCCPHALGVSDDDFNHRDLGGIVFLIRNPSSERLRVRIWVQILLAGLLLAGCAPPTPAAPATPLPRVEGTPPSPTPGPTDTPVSTGAPTRPSAPPATSTTVPPVPTVTPTEAALAVTITVLYDNNEYDERLRTAWGFACLVEGFDETILFDTGGDSGTLLSNMRTLGVDPQRVDTVVISHVHGDHVGGLGGFLDENQAVTVYLPESFPQSIGDAARDVGADVVKVQESVEICEHVLSTGELGDWIKEQSLVIETARGLVVITGCAHPGIVDIVRQAQEMTGQDVYLVVGGFHLGGTGTAEIEGIVEDFQQLGVQKVAPCHCSGDAARRLFKEAYGEDFILAGVGSTVQVHD